jgi:hypothetical protein
MERTILDATDEKENGRYARRSFWLFLMALACYCILVLFSDPITLRLMIGDVFWALGSPLIIAALIFHILGTVNSIKSIKHKELTSSKKSIGIIGNLGLLSLWVVLLLLHSIYL